ncbi:MAG: hypothetical protein NVS1B2_11140 [Vulcanimicrobiaceae bacterium]
MRRTTALYVGRDRVLLKTTRNLKMFVDSRDVSLAPHLMLDGLYEEHVEAALRKIVKPGMHVVDIGANVGFFTLQIAHDVGPSGSVTAFEADPGLAAILRDNVEINGFQQRATIVPCAVGDRSGRARFFVRDRHRGNGSLIAGIEQVPWNASDADAPIDVDLTSLDDHIAATKRRPQLVKIDAEGAESAIFRGARALLADGEPLTIVVEFMPKFFTEAGEDAASFLDTIDAAGFTIRLIEERRRKIVDTDRAALLSRRYSELLLTRGSRTR